MAPVGMRNYAAWFIAFLRRRQSMARQPFQQACHFLLCLRQLALQVLSPRTLMSHNAAGNQKA
jgi:hypothetical protein